MTSDPAILIDMLAHRSFMRLVLAVVSLQLVACGPSEPPRITYVLGEPAAGIEESEFLSGRPAIEVKQVLMPDYLDGSDIVIRRPGNVLQPSPTGRWAERLSLGTTRALADGLARRLPEFVVTTSAQDPPQPCQVLVNVDSFERNADQPVVLVAQWRILRGAARQALAGERVSLTESVTGSDDATLVAAMSRAVDDLAGRIAAGIHDLGPACVE